MLYITKSRDGPEFAVAPNRTLPPLGSDLKPQPVPRISDPSKIPFSTWRSTYKEYLDKMFHYFTCCMSSEINDQGNVFKYASDARIAFDRMIYESSENAKRSYVFFK